MKLNSKGQTLVIFIVLIPIIILLFGVVIDIGLMGTQKRKVNNVIKDAIEYGIKQDISEDKIKTIIDKDITYESIHIKKEKEIIVTIEYKYQTIFGFIKKNKLKKTYVGYKENNEIRIKEG